MRHNFILPILAILLTGLLAHTFNVHTVRANGTVYIRVDGSVDPPTTPIVTADNVTYVLNGNISDPIVIQRDNIVFDGAGFTVQGTGSDQGILLFGTNNVTIKHATIETFDMGILLMVSSNNTIIGNKLTDNNQGVKVVNSSSTNITGNDVHTNSGNGIDLYESPDSLIHENNITANAWSGIKLEGASCNDTKILENSVTANGQNGIMLTGSSAHNSVVGNNVTANSGVGIFLYTSPSNTVSDNRVTDNGEGIYLFISANDILAGNIMENNTYNFGVYGTDLETFTHSVDTSNLADGKPVYYLMNQSNTLISPETHPNVGYLGLVNCANMTVQGLNPPNNVHGVLLAFTNDSKITGNNLANQGAGIYLWSSYNNTLSGNGVTNSSYGIVLVYSSNNKIFHNTLRGNPAQADTEDCSNTWDDDYPSGGNHWSDYNGTDSDNDGIGDSPYAVDLNNTDRYPLMGTFNSFNATPEHTVETVCNSTISNFTFNGTAISFNVSGQTGTAGFCRINVPTALMNDTYRIFINGTEVTYTTLPISNSTHEYLYFSYTHSTQNVTIVPELPSSLILPLIMMTTLPALIIHKRKRSNRQAPHLTVQTWVSDSQ